MILDIVLDHVDFNDVFSKIVILYVSNLSILVPLCHQISNVVCFHFLDDFHKSVVETRGQIDLVLIAFFQTAKVFNI